MNSINLLTNIHKSTITDNVVVSAIVIGSINNFRIIDEIKQTEYIGQKLISFVKNSIEFGLNIT